MPIYSEEIANTRALHEQADTRRNGSSDLIATSSLPSHRRTPAELAAITRRNSLCKRMGDLHRKVAQ